MDMKVDSKLIKSEREKRAWSQEHLARVTGLGLRTIQRIEKTGVAAFESAKALAAVFSIDVAVLRAVDRPAPEKRRRSHFRPVMACVGALVSVGGALFIATAGFAEQVVLQIGTALNGDQVVEAGRFLTDENDDVDVQLIDDQLRLVIVPTIEPDGKVRLSARIFELQDGDYVLLSEPALVTADGEEAEIRLDSETGKSFRLVITPHRSPQRMPAHLKAICD